MKIIGIDLAASEENATGICVMDSSKALMQVLRTDREILDLIKNENPDLVAIDAPLFRGEIKIRNADRILKKYGAMPPTIPGMKKLSERGTRLAVNIELTDIRVIEVFPTASAKILGVYEMNFRKTARNLGIDMENKHELDAYLAALTGRLFLEGKTITIGDREGYVVVPKVL